MTRNSNRSIYGELMKDLSDFRKSTGDEPKKILMKQEFADRLKEEVSVEKDFETGEESFAGTDIKIEENINKDWVIV